ncbi:MAG: hypothetical protein RL701_4687 [Pseudomonadota bacterium]|jgi:hypothetical protein
MPAARLAKSLYVLLALCLCAGFLIVGVPRDLIPNELPALSLQEDLVLAQQRTDAQLIAAAPRTPAAERLLALYRSFGETELATLENAQLRAARRHDLHASYEHVREESGPQSVLALRALAVAKFEAVLDGSLKDETARSWLGVFPNVLIQYMATRDGLELAPHFVVRTLYKARWNRLLELPLESDLTQVERQAYFGWLGLHAGNLPLMQRREALLGYAAAGGKDAAEAQGVLAFMADDYVRAVECLERAYRENPSFRVRNYLRGARVVAAEARRGTANLTHGASTDAHI